MHHAYLILTHSFNILPNNNFLHKNVLIYYNINYFCNIYVASFYSNFVKIGLILSHLVQLHYLFPEAEESTVSGDSSDEVSSTFKSTDILMISPLLLSIQTAYWASFFLIRHFNRFWFRSSRKKYGTLITRRSYLVILGHTCHA